jgi:hypothetical protein
MNAQLTRAQRRQMQKMGERIDRVTHADRLFFERFPHRMHRVRLADQAEIGQQELLRGAVLWVPPDCRLFAIVRNIAPGVRLRLFTAGLENSETDLSEAYARQIFEASATPLTREIEAQLRAAVVRRDQ